MFKRIFVTFLSVLILSNLMSSVHIDSLGTTLVIAAVLTILNATLKPLLKFLMFPITMMTFGLFSFIINAIVLGVTFNMVQGAYVDSFGSTLLMSILIGILNGIFSKD